MSARRRVRWGTRWAVEGGALVLAAALVGAPGPAQDPAPTRLRPIRSPEKPVRVVPVLGGARALAAQTTPVVEAKVAYKVNGEGLTAAVLDTGLKMLPKIHPDFLNHDPDKPNPPYRVREAQNYTSDYDRDKKNANDLHGHGTHVAGIIGGVGKDDDIGVAPQASFIPIKVLPNEGEGDWTAVREGLEWVLTNHKEQRISVVNLSISDGANLTTDAGLGADAAKIRALIAKLREEKVAVVASAGNYYFENDGAQGMGFPAICRETISVGAIYDRRPPVLPFRYGNGADSCSTR
jgi:subtilisin family serine protease